jgi:hypothetical protein
MFWKLATVVLGATMIADVALAADLAPKTFTKAPVAGDPVYDWTGGYVGLNLGYGVASDPVNLMFVPAMAVNVRRSRRQAFSVAASSATISRPAALYSASKATSRRPA